jgi:transketolase
VIGGLGSAIAECISDRPGCSRLLRLGVQDQFGESGLADELLEKHGLQPLGITKQILAALP